MHGEYRVYMVHCVYTVYQTSVYIQCIYDTVYDRSSRVRGAGYRSYCVSDQNPPPPQCQPAPVLARTQARDGVRAFLEKPFAEKIQKHG